MNDKYTEAAFYENIRYNEKRSCQWWRGGGVFFLVALPGFSPSATFFFT